MQSIKLRRSLSKESYQTHYLQSVKSQIRKKYDPHSHQSHSQNKQQQNQQKDQQIVQTQNQEAKKMLNSNNNENNTNNNANNINNINNYNNNINLKTPQKNIKELENELNQTIKLREQMVENSLKMKNLNYNYNYNFSKQGFKTPKNLLKFSQQKPGSKSPKPQLKQNIQSKKILQLNITPNQKTQSQNQYQNNQFQNQKNFAKNYFATSAKSELNCNKNLINSNKRISTQQTCYTENNETCSPNKQSGQNLRKSHNFFQQKSSNEVGNLMDQKNSLQQYCLSACQKQRVKKNPYAHIKPRVSYSSNIVCYEHSSIYKSKSIYNKSQDLNHKNNRAQSEPQQIEQNSSSQESQFQMSKSSEISLNSLKSDPMAQNISINNSYLNKQYNNIQIKQESNYTSISPSPKRCRPSLTTTAKQDYRRQNINKNNDTINNKNNDINNNNKNNNVNNNKNENKSNKFFQKSQQQQTKSSKKSQNSYKQLHLKNLEYQQSHPKSRSLKSKKEIELEKYLLSIQKRYESPLEYRSQLYLQNTYKLQMEDEKEEKRNFFLQQKKKQEKIQLELDEKNKRRKNKNFQQKNQNLNQNQNQDQSQDQNQIQSLNQNQNSRKQLNQLARNLVEQSPKKFQRNNKKLSQSFDQNSSLIQSQNQSFQEMEQQKLDEILNDLKNSYKEKSQTDQEVLSTVIQLIKMQHKIASVTAKKQNYLAKLLQNSQFSQNSQFIGQVEKLNKYIFNVLKKETDNYQIQQEQNIKNNKQQENLRYIQTTPDELTYNTLDSSQLDNYFNQDNQITNKIKNNKNNDINNSKKDFQKIQNNSTTNKSKTKIDFSQPLYNSMSPSQRGNLKNIIIQNNSIQINNNSQRQKRLSFEEVQKSQLDEFQDLEHQVNSTKHINQVNLNNGSHFTQYQEQNQLYQKDVNSKNSEYTKTQNEQKYQNIHPSQIVFEKSESGNTSQKDQNQYNKISNQNQNLNQKPKLVKNSNQKNISQNSNDYPIFSNLNSQKQLQKQNLDFQQQEQQNIDFLLQQQQNLDFPQQQQSLDFQQQEQQQQQQFRLQAFTPSKLKIKLHRSISLQDSERLGQKKVQKYKGLSEQHSIHEEEEEDQNKEFQNVPQDSVQQQQIMEKQQEQNEKLRNLLQEYEKSQNSEKKQLKQGILEQLQSISPNQYQHIDKYISDLELDNWEKDCQILDMQLRIDEVKQQQQTQNLRNFNYVQSSLSFDNKSIKKTNQLSKSNRIIGVQPFQVNKYSKSIQSFNSNTDSPMNSNFKNPICFSNQGQSNDEKKLEIQITESFNQSRILDMNENKSSEKNTITNNQLKRNYEQIQQEIENSCLTFENKLSNYKQIQNKQQDLEKEEQKLEIQQLQQQDYLQQQISEQKDIKNINFDGQNQVLNYQQQQENSDINKREQSKSSQKQKNSLKKLDIFDSKSKLKKQFKEDLFQTNSNIDNGYDNGGENQSERTISDIKTKENINSIDKKTETDNFYPQSEELEQNSQKNQDQSIEQQIYSEYKTQNQRLMDIFKQKLNKQYEIKLEELRQSSPTTQKKNQAQNQTQILQQLIENTQKNLQINFEQNEQKLNTCSQQSLDLVNYNDINSILNKNNNNIDLIRQKVDNLKQSLTKIKSPKKEQKSHLYINTNIQNNYQQQQEEQNNYNQQQEYNNQQEQNNQYQQQKSELPQNPNQFYNKEEYRSKKQAFQIQSSNDLYSPIQQLELQNQLKLKYSQMEHDKDKQNNLEGKISPIIYQTGSKSGQKDFIINSSDNAEENFQNDLSSQIQQTIQNSHQFQQLSSLKQSQTYFPTEFSQDKQNLSQNYNNNKNSVSVKNFFDYQENSGSQNKNLTMQQSPKFYYNSNCQSKSIEKDRQSEKETFQNLNSFSLNKDNQFVNESPVNPSKKNYCFQENNYQNQTQNGFNQNQFQQNQQQSQPNNLYSNKNGQNKDLKYSNLIENSSNKKMNIPNININIQNNNSNQILNLPQNFFQQYSGQKNQEKSQSLLNFVKNQCQLAKNSTIGIYEKQMQIESQIESHTQSVNQSYALNSQQKHMENYQEGDFNKNAVNQLINKDEYAIVGPLAQATHIVIDQKFDCPELLCCEIANQYKIYQSNSEFQYDENQQPIAVWDEESSFLCRCFCRMARSFKGELKIQDKKASLVEAPYKCHNPIPCCSCLCARPTIQVANQNNELIGSLQMPCWCFFKGWGNFDIMELRVLDKSGNLKYLIHSTCCQKSVCCLPLQCLGCEKIKYDIKNTAKQVVGNIYNIYSGCCKEVCTQADKFGVAFPDNDEPHNKLLLTQAAIWLDYLQYMA